MNSSLEQIVRAVLYEGYVLYPYRASSIKNQRERFTFGRVYPQIYGQAQNDTEPSSMLTECLVQSQANHPSVEITVRFLQPLAREVGVLHTPLAVWTEGIEPDFQIVPELHAGGTVYRPWQEALERAVKIPTLKLRAAGTAIHPFNFEATRALEPIRDDQNRVIGVLLRRSEGIHGVVEIGAETLNDQLFKVTAAVTNLSSVPQALLTDSTAVLLRTFASTHTVLQAHEAQFISLMDPPIELKTAAVGCRNVGAWPVLVGDETKPERVTMLASPIILYDYPKIAPESRGDLFDSTEFDEILTLRILTMSDDEKREMSNVDALARRLLERTEALPQPDLLKMHGASRELRSIDEELFGGGAPLEGVSLNDTYLTPGHRVRIRPKARADVMDLALAGRIALIESVQQDAEQRIHLALVLEDDPGKDLGMLRQPGHRFFYGLDEIELLES